MSDTATTNPATPHPAPDAPQGPDAPPAPDAPPERLGVLPWPTALSHATTHDPRSAYVETFWLPILGPSTTLLLRRLAAEFDGEPEGFELDCIAMSRELGLGTKFTRRSPFVRTLDRCVRFNLAKLDGELLHVRTRLLSLSDHQTRRLSNRLQQLHSAWTLDPSTDGEHRRVELVRATHLARTLLALGESANTAERQLHQWQFHPSISWHAVQWAQTDHGDGPSATD